MPSSNRSRAPLAREPGTPEARVAVVGRLPADPAWVGVASSAGSYRLAYVRADRSTAIPPPSERDVPDLVAAAMAFYADELDAPLPALEATHQDIADALRWVVDRTADMPQAQLLREAMDAVDDGLPTEVILARLDRAYRALETDEPADLLGRLTSRYRSLTRER